MWIRSVALCIALISGAQAAQIEYLQTSESNNTYTVTLRAQVDVPSSYALHTLSNPDRVASLNDVIVDVEHLPSTDPAVKRIRDHVYVCVMLYCIEYRNTSQLRLSKEGIIRLDVEPENSDFESGHITWRVEPLDEKRSRVSFTSESKPSFWVPPLVGATLMKTQMSDTVLEMLNQMECEYQGKKDCDQSTVIDSTATESDFY